mgnify:CR=1 FL=1
MLFSVLSGLISLSAVLLVPSPAFRSMSLGFMLSVLFVLNVINPEALVLDRNLSRQSSAAVPFDAAYAGSLADAVPLKGADTASVEFIAPDRGPFVLEARSAGQVVRTWRVRVR